MKSRPGSPPLDEVYPILHVDALRLRVKDDGRTGNWPCPALGADLRGGKHSFAHDTHRHATRMLRGPKKVATAVCARTTAISRQSALMGLLNLGVEDYLE